MPSSNKTPNIGLDQWSSGDSLSDFFTALNADFSKIDTYVKNAILAAHPIGSKEFNDGTDPATYLGGTWVQTAQGCFIVGVNTGDTDFATSGKTGGEKAHTLTIAEMPNHNHPMGYKSSGSAGSGSVVPAGTDRNNTANDIIDAIGGGEPHNNLPPYQAMYVWTRTA